MLHQATARASRVARHTSYADCASVVRTSSAALALIDPLGRIVALSPRLALRLGLEDGNVLNGLDFRRLWARDQRPAIDATLARARRGGTAHADLDMAYVLGTDPDIPTIARVTLRPASPSGAVLMTMDLPA